jgi:hypothetical protein
MTMPTPSLTDTARAYWDAGLTPMPRVIGHVEPSYIDAVTGEIHSIPWGNYKVQQPDWLTVMRWFIQSDPATVGIILLTGSAPQPRNRGATPLQILELETANIFFAYLESLTFVGHANIWHRLVVERTPSGGGHLGFLCTAIGDKQKQTLARCKTDSKILIELLQNQPCTVAPTTIRCKPEHPAGACYTLAQGNWARPKEISPEQRQILLDVARTFNEVPEQTAREPHAQASASTRPGDCLNEQADLDWWQTLLDRHGWRDVSRPGLRGQGIAYFQRPGKFGRQPSATYGVTGPYLYVFSSNALPFNADSAYSPFVAYTLLEHGGDFLAAAKALAEQGYGTPLTQSTPITTPTIRRTLRRTLARALR